MSSVDYMQWNVLNVINALKMVIIITFNFNSTSHRRPSKYSSSRSGVGSNYVQVYRVYITGRMQIRKYVGIRGLVLSIVQTVDILFTPAQSSVHT